MKHRILYLLSALCILLTGCSALPVNTGDEIAYWTGETPFNAAVIPAAPTCTDGVFYADGQALPTETFSGTLPEGQLTFLWCQYDGQIFLQNQQEDWSAEPSPAPWTPPCAACVTRSSWIRAGTLWRGWRAAN